MKVEILEDKKNELLKRQEVKLIFYSEKNPSFQEALKIISGEVKKPEENIAIKGIKGKFGRKSFLINAFVYDSKEEKERIEPKKKEKKKKQETQEEQPAQQQQEQPVEKPEKPTEEKAEPTQQEQKQETAEKPEKERGE